MIDTQVEAKFCKSCGSPIYWLLNDNTQGKAPIDAVADPGGNCVILDDGVHYHVLHKGEVAPDPKKVHTSHLQTCLKASQFTKKGASR